MGSGEIVTSDRRGELVSRKGTPVLLLVLTLAIVPLATADHDDRGTPSLAPFDDDGLQVPTSGSLIPSTVNEARDEPVCADSVPRSEEVGCARWVERSDTSAAGTDDAEDLAITGDRLIVASAIQGTDDAMDAGVAAYEQEDGSPVWRTRLDPSGDGHDQADAVIVDEAAGLAVVVGVKDRLSSGHGLFAVGLDLEDGSVVWEREVPETSTIDRFSIDAVGGPDGSIHIVGAVSSGRYVASLDTATGALHWQTLDPYDHPYPWAGAAADPSGRHVYAAGNLPLTAYDADTGDVVWRAEDVYEAHGWAEQLAVAPDGETVALSGSWYPEGNAFPNFEQFVAAYRADNGTRAWAASLTGSGESGDFAESLAIGPNAETLAVGGTRSRLVEELVTEQPEEDEDHARDPIVAAFDLDGGDQRWIEQTESPILETPDELAFGPTGDRIFAAGSYTEDDGYDAVTKAYDARTGDRAWKAAIDLLGDTTETVGRMSTDGQGRVHLAGTGFQEYCCGSTQFVASYGYNGPSLTLPQN